MIFNINYMINNPFLPSYLSISFNEIIESIYIVCMKDNYDKSINIKLYEKNLDKESYDLISKNIEYIPCLFNILNNEYYRNRAIYMTKQETRIIAIIIFELTKKSVELLLGQYVCNDIYNVIYLKCCFNNFHTNYNLIENIKSFIKDDYWFQNKKTFENEGFIQRKFNSSINSIKLLIPFKITNLPLNKTQINTIFDQLYNEKDLFDVFNMMAISRVLCHLVVNNRKVLIKMSQIFQNYLSFYKYLLGYAFLTFYLEEVSAKIKTDDKIVFKIDTASCLPNFPYAADDIHQSPYITLLVSDNTMNINNNYMSCGYQMNEPCYGIENLVEFKKKLNIFISGFPRTNIFKGLEWENKFILTGSAIPACVQKNNPLFNRFPNKNRIAIAFEKLYKDADVNLICFAKDIVTYIENIKLLKKLLEKNTSKNVKIEIINSTIVRVKKTKNKYEVYKKLKQEITDSHTKQNYIGEIWDQYHALTENITYVENEEESIQENIQFKIKISKIRTITITNSELSTEKIFQEISQYSLPCIRGYYDGNNVFLLPSCITALQTGINIDCKITKNPEIIINKYRMRGYGTILNQSEIIYLNKCNTKYIENITDELELTGFKEYTSKIYGETNIQSKSTNTIKTLSQLSSFYNLNNKTDLDMINFKTINKNGTINKYEDWIASAYYSIHNQNIIKNL